MECIEKLVDVAINVYGKPYQTLATLKTLMLHSGKHIDKIYFIQESKQPPWGANIDIVSLSYASSQGNLDIVKYLVEHGADIHARNNEALTLATEEGHEHVINYLIAKGAKY